jgi:hypothetical protein
VVTPLPLAQATTKVFPDVEGVGFSRSSSKVRSRGAAGYCLERLAKLFNQLFRIPFIHGKEQLQMQQGIGIDMGKNQPA